MQQHISETYPTHFLGNPAQRLKRTWDFRDILSSDDEDEDGECPDEWEEGARMERDPSVAPVEDDDAPIWDTLPDPEINECGTHCR